MPPYIPLNGRNASKKADASSAVTKAISLAIALFLCHRFVSEAPLHQTVLILGTIPAAVPSPLPQQALLEADLEAGPTTSQQKLRPGVKSLLGTMVPPDIC